jgi:aldehyde dehydrogenase (NAD+)/betaine-aldehyde dehydrogenase
MVSFDHLLKFYIDGQWTAPADPDNVHKVLNPATGKASGAVAFGAPADVDAAVAAARRAFAGYAAWPQERRNALLQRICDIYARRIEDFAWAISLEMGAPYASLSLAVQAPVGLWHFQAALGIAQEFPFTRRLGGTAVVREPVGVCALITPWNWPINQIVCKVAPALAVGCTIVLKPSQNAPYSAMLLAEVLHEAGVPPGVFNLVQGEGAQLGAALASHPQVDMISLTGSNAAGASIAKLAADTVKRVSLELGGKSANIILPGADLERAVAHGVQTMMNNSGQTCAAPSRMLVPRGSLAAAERLAAQACAALVVGDPMAAATTVGPIANERQYRKVVSMIEAGVRDGARLVAGGAEPPPGLAGGYFVRPTVFSDVNNQMSIAREEIFGPVLCMIPYDSEQEAIEIANDSPYGLSGYVYGASVARAEAVARQLRTGMVHLNGAGVDITAPWGGYKQSGNGREWGAWGFDEFLETKALMGAGAA